MGRRRNRDGSSMGVLITLVVIATLLCVTLIIVMYMDRNGMPFGKGADDKLTEMTEDDNTETLAPEEDAAISVNDEGNADGLGMIPDDKTVDIAALKSSNPDIYAWLYIPEAGIDEPILQSSKDINYYVSHNAEGKDDENGAVFTQMLNSKDFKDNLTVIYGHNSGDDKGFSNLKVFSDPEYFRNYPYIFIYTEDKVLVYQTFAAYESDDKLIVMFYGTQDDEMYHIYLSNIEGYAGLDGKLDKEAWPSFEDKIITLSTGIIGRDDRRFLVQAKLVREENR